MVGCLLRAAAAAPSARSTDLIVSLAANVPERLSEFFDALASGTGSSSGGGAAQEAAVLRLCRLAPHYAHTVRAQLVARRTLPKLALRLTLEICKDVVPFLSGLLPDRKLWPWMAKVIRLDWSSNRGGGKSGSKSEGVGDVGMYAAVAAALAEASAASMADGKGPGAATAALARINCALYCTGGTQQPPAEPGSPLDAVAEALTARHPATPGGARLVELTLCLFCVSPALVISSCERGTVTGWLAMLEARLSEYGSGPGDSYADMLLLMATHFHSGDIKAVADLVRTTLGFRLDIPADGLKRLSSEFAVLFPPSKVAPMAVNVGVTEGLSAELQGFASIHCVHQCLRSRSFVMNRVSPAGWLRRQMLAAAPNLPVHPLLISCVQALADFAVDPFGTELSGNSHIPRVQDQDRCRIQLSKFTDQEVVAMFDTSSTSSTSRVAQVLMLLYVLSFNHAVEARVRRLHQHPDSLAPLTPKKYAPSVMSAVPIKQLLGIAEQDAVYEAVFPVLLSFVIEQYPELVDGRTLAADEEHVAMASTPATGAATAIAALTTPAASSDIDLINAPAHAVGMLQGLMDLPADQLMQHAPLLLDVVLPALLLEGTQRRLAALFRPLWDRLNSVMPRKLWLWTVQRLQPQTGWRREITHDTLTLDPLAVLRCDPRVFRVPSLLGILLTVLKAYMDASGAMLAARCAAAPPPAHARSGSLASAAGSGASSDVEQDRAAFLSTLVMTQNAAIVQMLFEVCLEEQPAAATAASAASSSEDPGQLQEARILVCAFVHLLFIDNPLLLKLVHFQGYNPDLIEVLVIGIPSMHVCIDFLGELMVQPSLEQHVFAVLLTGHLATRYPIPKMLTCALAALGKMHELAHADARTREAFFLPTFETLVRLCTAFPKISESAIELLLKVQAIHRAHLAANTDVREGASGGLQARVTETFDKIASEVLLPNALNV